LTASISARLFGTLSQSPPGTLGVASLPLVFWEAQLRELWAQKLPVTGCVHVGKQQFIPFLARREEKTWPNSPHMALCCAGKEDEAE